ncbi:MAG TPA: DUF3592 domain-containing protein [Deltaproteobacteria bacterium]|nr:DUF3592 domain-containing protein [Deltaproteobacteria bacterium]
MNKNILLGIVFLAAGIGVAAWGFMNLSTAMESRSWPIAEGKIVSSQVVKKVERYTDSNNRRRNRTIYEAQVRYDYKVDGRSLIGSRVTMADSGSSSESRAQKISMSYPAGSPCTVYYNPDKPEEAVLKAGITFATLMFPAIGILFAVIGLAILSMGRKSSPPGQL